MPPWPAPQVPYGVVQPLCTFNQDTYEGHPWRLRDEHSGEVLAEYVGPQVIDVNDCRVLHE